MDKTEFGLGVGSHFAFGSAAVSCENIENRTRTTLIPHLTSSPGNAGKKVNDKIISHQDYRCGNRQHSNSTTA